MSVSCECCVYCQVEVPATGWSPVQRSPTDCGVSMCVIQESQEWGGLGPWWAVARDGRKELGHWSESSNGSVCITPTITQIYKFYFKFCLETSVKYCGQPILGCRSSHMFSCHICGIQIHHLISVLRADVVPHWGFSSIEGLSRGRSMDHPHIRTGHTQFAVLCLGLFMLWYGMATCGSLRYADVVLEDRVQSVYILLI